MVQLSLTQSGPRKTFGQNGQLDDRNWEKVHYGSMSAPALGEADLPSPFSPLLCLAERRSCVLDMGVGAEVVRRHFIVRQ